VDTQLKYSAAKIRINAILQTTLAPSTLAESKNKGEKVNLSVATVANRAIYTSSHEGAGITGQIIMDDPKGVKKQPNEIKPEPI